MLPGWLLQPDQPCPDPVEEALLALRPRAGAQPLPRLFRHGLGEVLRLVLADTAVEFRPQLVVAADGRQEVGAAARLQPHPQPPVGPDEGVASIFVTVDRGSTECVGLHAAKRATRFEALEPIRQGVRERFGGFAQDVAGGLKLRHDHGSRFVADDFQAAIAFLGLASSPAFVREPEGNGCAERFIRTLKENPLWVRRFATVEEPRPALLEFRRCYNETWIVERHGYRTPAQVRADQLGALTAAA